MDIPRVALDGYTSAKLVLDFSFQGQAQNYARGGRYGGCTVPPSGRSCAFDRGRIISFHSPTKTKRGTGTKWAQQKQFSSLSQLGAGSSDECEAATTGGPGEPAARS